MKNVKRRFETFSFFDYTGIAGHLSKMAEKGWLIEKISNTGWVYRKIAPQKLTFYVTYFPNASEFDPCPTQEQQTFHDFCRHTGWKLAAAAAQMQVFFNEQENPVPIETDPVLQTAVIHAAAKKSFLPTHLLLLLISVVNIILFVLTCSSDPVGLLAGGANLFTGFAWLMLFITVIIELYSYFSWHAKAKKLAAFGESAETFSFSRIRLSILAAVLAGYAYWLAAILWNGPVFWKIVCICMILYLAVLFFAVSGIRQLLKRKNVPRNLNRTITLFSCFVLSLAILSSITYTILRCSQKGLFDRGRETYEHNGAVFTVYQDELPLTIEHLLGTSRDGYIKERRSDESLLLARYEMRQYPRFDTPDFSDLPDLSYEITEIKLPVLYEFCKNSLLNAEQDETADGRTVFINHFEPSDPVPWHAEDAWQLIRGTGPADRYLLCYENRIVDIRFSWQPAEEQMAAVSARLNPPL